MRIIEIDSIYRSRPEGSESKLKTYSDGWKIILFIVNLFRQEKPLTFFFINLFLFSIGLDFYIYPRSV